MPTVIRASSLPHYTDCLRRAAARMLAPELVNLGYNVRSLKSSIGAAVGTATHNAMEVAMMLRAENKPFEKEIEEVSEISISKSIEQGIIWDDTTPTKEVAIKQAIRQAKSVINKFPELKGINIEEEFKANIGDNFILSGHIDIRKGGVIIDLKTGAMRRANQAQYGAYSLLCRTNGINISRIGEIYVKRIGINKPQPEPLIVEYSVSEAEKMAWEIIKKIKSDVCKFRQTSDVWSFLANPNSLMCTPDYCPAFGTNFCNCHKKEN